MRIPAVAVLVLTMALVTPAFAKKKPTPTPTNEPRIVEINAVSITISIGTSGEEHQEFKITKDTKITLDGAPTTTDNLLAGMLAEVTPSDADPTVAVSIAAKDAPKH